MEDEIKRQEDSPIRLYSFRVPGYVPGIPRNFPGGMQALINDETKEVLAEGPLGLPLSLPEDTTPEGPKQEEKPVQAEQVPPAPGGEVAQPNDSGVAASSSFSFIPEAPSGSVGG